MCIGMRATFYETPIIPEAIKKQQGLNTKPFKPF